VAGFKYRENIIVQPIVFLAGVDRRVKIECQANIIGRAAAPFAM
jgi:hypothetical protein